jgi:PKD repeat protein
MRITLAVLVGIAALLLPATASAAPPVNDSFANATVIDPSSLPFNDAVTIDEATVEGGEPGACYYGNAQTVWYSLTPTSNAVLRLSRSSSFYYSFAAIYTQTGSGLSGLSALGCADWAFGTSTITVGIQAGKTYFIQAGSSFTSSGTSSISVQLVPPPPNDDFANAKAIGSLPFSDSVDVTGASVEAGEPTPSCGYGQSPGTAWYAFTPAASGSLTASSPWSGFYSQVAAYTGGALGSLNQLGCRTYGQPLTFHANAGTTYYLQIGGVFGGRGTINVNLDVAPNPIAGFGFNPGDPSTFDTVQFYDQSSDPAQVGFSSEVWNFGDGGTASSPGCCPTHTYLADGVYKVKLTVTTTDGRTASSSRDVEVRTHDVAIAKLTVPQSASVGQTRSIAVGLANRRYAETVRIDLYRSTASGFVLFASSTQLVPVRGGNKTSDFAFNYTFIAEDGALGKVTFKAIATIVDHRDALPTDNEAISLPTKVK